MYNIYMYMYMYNYITSSYVLRYKISVLCTCCIMVYRCLTCPPLPSPPALSVAVSGDLILTLPRNRTTVFANTWPEPRFHEQFSYQWEKLAGPGPGQWSGETGSTLGLYEVRGGGRLWNLTNSNTQGTDRKVKLTESYIY